MSQLYETERGEYGPYSGADRYPMFEERRCRGCPQDGVVMYRAEMGYIHLCPDTLDAMLEVMRLSDEVIEWAIHESSLVVSGGRDIG